jgi:hypothetical protein
MNAKNYINDLSSLCGARKIVIDEGKAKGMRFIQMFNGCINLMVSVDRALDIYQAEFQGQNVVFLSKNGLVNPSLSSNAISFINDFGGGLLYTCGLDNIGSPRENFVQHGSISYIPANHVNIKNGYIKEDFFISVEGSMHYTSLFGHDLILNRKITLFYDKPNIHIEDTIINQNGYEDHYMLMYHFNFGYPFINEHTKIKFEEIVKTEIFNQDETKTYGDYHQLEKPDIKKPEEVFVHQLKEGKSRIDVMNVEDCATIEFNTKRLKYLTEWKSMAKGDYALGIEPSTTSLINREYLKIKAHDKHNYQVTLKFRNIIRGEDNE